MTARNPWGGQIGKPAVLKVARGIAARDGLGWPRALRKALAWARRKADGGAAPADPYAALRARGIVSPRDRSADAEAHFARLRRRQGGSQFWGGRWMPLRFSTQEETMTDTQRRALLGALIVAPVAALPAPALADAGPLTALCSAARQGGDELLARAARFDADATFRAICAAALEARKAHGGACERYWQARNAAEAETPFPASLILTRRGTCEGERLEWEERWDPARDFMGLRLDTCALRRQRQTGETLPQARAALRAEFDGWRQARDAAEQVRDLPTLSAAMDEAGGERYQRAMEAIKQHRARSAETLLTKLLLLDADGEWPREPEDLQGIIADTLGALAS